MAGYKVEICGVNTATLPLLDSSEKETLFHRIKNGDQQARELYITGNLRLVLSVIGRFSSSGENIDDLFQIGCIGLMKAIDNFDLSHTPPRPACGRLPQTAHPVLLLVIAAHTAPSSPAAHGRNRTIQKSTAARFL